ncbi:MAG: S41 family peptidase, partial [Acidobacteriota bacterium]|nr:S41 family peptidase [Acidobacteriota bacterium]
GTVVILIDELSLSTSEIFASGMQEAGRAIVVGERSGGAALPSLFKKLPTGALLQHAIADFKTPQGAEIEGRGTVPDIEVKWNRRALLEGRDAQLDAALEYIVKGKG